MKALFYTLFLLFPFLMFGQEKDTTFFSVDSLGIKKVSAYTFIGNNKGLHGNGPHLIKRTITKYDKNGKLIYISHKTIRSKGCIRDTPEFNIISFDKSGYVMTLKLKNQRVIHIKEFDSENKLCTKTKIKYRKPYTLPDWVDNEDED